MDFSGVVTQDVLQAALEKKENTFSKNSAFNKNFSDTDKDYCHAGKRLMPEDPFLLRERIMYIRSGQN